MCLSVELSQLWPNASVCCQCGPHKYVQIFLFSASRCHNAIGSVVAFGWRRMAYNFLSISLCLSCSVCQECFTGNEMRLKIDPYIIYSSILHILCVFVNELSIALSTHKENDTNAEMENEEMRKRAHEPKTDGFYIWSHSIFLVLQYINQLFN